MQLGIYRHFKGEEYKVIGLAKYEADMSDMVVYRPLYSVTDLGEDFSKNPLFIRTYENFVQQVTDETGKQVPRFFYLGK